MKKIYPLFIIALGLILNSNIASAITTQPSPSLPSISSPIGSTTIMDLFDRVFTFLLAIGVPILVLFIIVGAYMILTSAGNPGKLKTGKDTIVWACIGYAILLLSKGISLIIINVLSK